MAWCVDMSVGGRAGAEVVRERDQEASHPHTLLDSAGGWGSIPDPRLNVLLLMLGVSFPKKSRQRNELLF